MDESENNPKIEKKQDEDTPAFDARAKTAVGSVHPGTAPEDQDPDRKEKLEDFRIDTGKDSVPTSPGAQGPQQDRNEKQNKEKVEPVEAEPVLGTKTEERIDKILLSFSNKFCLRTCTPKNQVSEGTIKELEIGKNTVLVVNKHFPKAKWIDSPEANLGLGVLGLSAAIVINRVIDLYEKGKIESEALNKFLDFMGIEKSQLDIKEPGAT